MRVPLPLTLFAVLALAACGGGTAATATPLTGATATPAGATATPAAASATPAADAVVCGTAGGGTAATIANFAFDPAAITVNVGEAVTWTNNDSATHTVTFDSGPDCGNVANGATVTATFGVAGTYPYHCNIHKSMKGTVTVNG